MQDVKSSTMSHIGHDLESQTLTIRFHNGATYAYSGVSPEEHQALVNASSIGKHFMAHIRDKYKGKRVS